jgi:serine/threonine-protein kinase
VLGLDREGDGKVTGEGVESVGYMSPEHLGAGVVDGRSDIFSFGVVLYEMLTGLSPFRRVTDSDTVQAVLAEDPPPVSHNSSRVLPVFDGIVQRCLEKRPEDRYRSPAEIAAALKAIAGVPPVAGRLQPAPRAPYAPFILIPIIIAAALALALLLVGYRALLHRVEENGFSETSRVFETGDYD